MSEAVEFSPRNVAAKTIKNVKRPRPLKTLPEGMSANTGYLNNNAGVYQGSLDLSESEVLLLMGEVNERLRMRNFDAACQAKVAKLNRVLKTAGPDVELRSQEFMNSLMRTLCEVCRDQNLDLATKLNVLEIIERRQGGWKENEAIAAYYRQKMVQADANQDCELQDSAIFASSRSQSPPKNQSRNLLALLASGGLPFAEEQTNSPLRRLLSQQHQSESVGLGPAEFLFRQASLPAGMNGDGGVESGNSDNVLNKLLCRSGEEKLLFDKTKGHSGGKVRFFPSAPSLPSASDCNMNVIHNHGNMGKTNIFKTEVEVNGCNKLVINGESLGLVNTAKQVLEEFFHICRKDDHFTISGLLEKPISYKREELLAMAKSPLCQGPPPEWDIIIGNCPFIVKREGPTSKHFLREMAEIRKQEGAKQM